MADKKIPESEHPGYVVEDNDLSGYVGVSPEYQTYADEASKPLVADDDDGVEAKAVKNAQKAAERAEVETNAYGLPDSGNSPFKSAVDDDGEPVGDPYKDESESKSEAKADDSDEPRKTAARSTARTSTASAAK